MSEQANGSETSRAALLAERKLELEIREKEWGLSFWGKATRFAPVVSVLVAVIGIFGSTYWYFAQERLETRRLSQEAITTLKREFASDNPVARTGAAVALSDYPHEAIALLVSTSSLGAIDRDTGREDLQFSNAVMDSLRQIGAPALPSLLRLIRQVQFDVRRIFPGKVSSESLDTALQRYLYDPPPAGLSADALTERLGLSYVRGRLTEPEFARVVSALSQPRSRTQALANRNGVAVLADLLRLARREDLDLSGLILLGNFADVPLGKARLADAYLAGADFTGANLTGADLSGANLTNANLVRAELGGADLSRADLNIARLADADLTGADLSEVDGDGADFSGADLAGATLTGARLLQVRFVGSVLKGADLSGAILTDSDLSGADLTDARLDRAILRDASLSKVTGLRSVAGLALTNFGGVGGLSAADRAYVQAHGAVFGNAVGVALDMFPADIALPAGLATMLRYDAASGTLVWQGAAGMTNGEYDALRSLSEDVAYRNAVLDLKYRSFFLHN